MTATLLLLLVVGTALPAWSLPFGMTDLPVPTLLVEGEEIEPVDITKTYVSPMVEKPSEVEQVMNMVLSMIYEENFEKYTAYNPELKGNMPLDGIARILMVISALDPDSRIQWEPRVGSYRVYDSRPNAFYFIFMPPKEEYWGSLLFTRAPGQTELNTPIRQPQRFWSWFNEEEGLFSGLRWTVEDTIPRLLGIGGFVIAILLLTEVVRLILGIGTSYLRGRKRG